MSLVIRMNPCFNISMIGSIKRLTFAAIFSVVTIAIIEPNVVAADAPGAKQLLTVIAQAEVDRQPPRSVDLDSSAPNQMTPEKSREMYNFRQVMQSLPFVVVAIIGLIGALLLIKKKSKQKKITKQNR